MSMFDRTTIGGVVYQALMQAARSGNLPAFDLNPNTQLGEILRRLCEYTDPAPDGADDKQIIQHTLREFYRVDHTDVLHHATIGEVEKLADELRGSIDRGCTDLVAIHQRVAALYEQYVRMVEREVALDPVLSAHYQEDLQTSVEYPAMNWNNTYFRGNEEAIIRSLHEAVDVEGTRPSLMVMQRFSAAVCERFDAFHRELNAGSDASSPHLIPTKLVDDQLPTIVDRLSAHYQDTELANDLAVRMSYRLVLASNALVMDLRSFTANLQMSQVMGHCTRLLGQLPALVVIEDQLATAIANSDDAPLSPTDRQKLQRQMALVHEYLMACEYFLVWARRVHFADTVLYPNNTVNPDRFAELVNQGGSAQLLGQYVRQLNDRGEGLPTLPHGIQLAAVLSRMQQIREASQQHDEQTASKVELQMFAIRVDGLSKTLLDELYPPETRADQPAGRIKDSMTFLRELARSRLSAGMAPDGILYDGLFCSDTWRGSFAKVLYARYGAAYAKTLASHSSLDTETLNDIGINVLIDLVIGMVRDVAGSAKN